MLSRREMMAATATAAAAGFRPPLAPAADAPPTSLSEPGRKLEDARLRAPKTLDDYFPFAVPATREEWERRRVRLREQLLVALGLWPLPEKTPLNAVVHGKVQRDGYTVEKVFFASLPGHSVSGNLYRPAGTTGRGPAVLSPHGHWPNGRFYEAPGKDVERQLRTGAEKTREGAKFPLQARCATLARMGVTVFHYDMVGTADSTAIPHREGFQDAAADLRLQSFMGLQTWNSIRALDFLTGLPEVDPTKVGVTGASGGGTQTFILCAVDDRPAAAFPAVMVSTAMQGGCVCENCSHLRVGTGNVELAALFAPKPLAMSGADDWTKELMTKGFPELKKLYALYGKGENVAARVWPEYPHNYNQPAREFMYAWFARHLLGRDEPVTERPLTPVPPKELSVYDAAHPRPADELGAAQLRGRMTAAAERQLAALTPKDAASLTEFRRVVGTALRVMVHDELPKEVAVRKGPVASDHDGFRLHLAVLGRPDEGDAVPCAGVFGPRGPGDTLVVWAHPRGKASLFDGDKLAGPVRALVAAGCAVVAPDVFGVGELAPDKPYPVNPAFAGFTFGYNRTPLANRVHDVLTLVGFGTTVFKAKTVHLVGWGEAGPWVVLAKALAGPAVTRTAADLNRFRFDKVTAPADPMMLPGAVKYGGLGAFLALCAPDPFLAYNDADPGRRPDAAYAAAAAGGRLTRTGDGIAPDKVVEWLVK